MAYDPAKHHRHSIRIPGYDYAQAGAYYVTLVTQGRECLFAEVKHDQMIRTRLGEIVQAEWFRSAEMRREIRLRDDEFVVMPNHVHGILWIIEAPDPDPARVRADGVRPAVDENATHAGVRADGVRPAVDGNAIHAGATHAGATHAGAYHAPLRRASRSLSSFVAGFKAAVTGRARRELGIATVWQRNFYEHIIRDDDDYERIYNYIQSNPAAWELGERKK